MVLFPQKSQRDSLLSDISSGKTRVVDLSYAINDKLVPWPGDKKWFEAKVNATVEKDGYFTRSFWMLEHYGTHLDAPIHFPPGKAPVEKGAVHLGLDELENEMNQLARHYGQMIGVKYGEPFLVKELMKVDDVVKMEVRSV